MSSCYNCTTPNPCRCLGIRTYVPASCPAPNEECCLTACNGLVKCEDSVGPCGAVGTYDLTDLENNITGCADGTIVYRLNSYNIDIFASVVISTAGLITFTTKDADTAGKYGDISYKVICKTREECADCGELGANGIVTVGVKDLCLAHSCEQGEVCDACTGGCVNPDVDLVAEVDSYDSNMNAQVN